MDVSLYNLENYKSVSNSNGLTKIYDTSVNNTAIDEEIFNLKIKKTEFVILVFSETMYFIIVIKSLVRVYKTRDWHFWFLITAALFALMNNFSDIIYRILAPFGNINCTSFFISFFKFSATLNWIPISYYQVCRLHRITKRYYKENWHRIIIAISIFFSIAYSFCYFLNLYFFEGKSDKFGGCVVNNKYKKLTVGIEVSDITDTAISLLIVIITLLISLRNLKNYKLRHLKLKAVLDNNVIVFIILVVSKILFYYIIYKNADKPGGDIWWDTLSVIVLWCAYTLLNLKPRLNEKMERNNMINNPRRNKNYLKDLPNFAYQDSPRNKFQNYYNRNSKGELNFPSLMNKDELFKMNNAYNNFQNNKYNYNNYNNFNYNNYNKYNNNNSSNNNKKNYQDYQNNYSSVSNKSNTSNINMNIIPMESNSRNMKYNFNEGSSYIGMSSINSNHRQY